ncbi:hypothetical protein [Nocardia gipuzkoensis]|uniref:hypothetical protein n=1 Tax=Nocardia gipuzkoensis TaxID=2749991 RepID=UPI00237E0FE5|nr:hypothetical protein [Nocardia gipuzkoensis]MDE1671755.1 hypothetical protein [Nocardia gipuzkoensis]
MDEIVIRRASWCEYEYRGCPVGCPLEAAEARLREAHRRWHDCSQSYQDPDDFRDALNSAVQALRNVTFVLQSAKSHIPDFDAWYAPEQAAMRSDRILRWIVDSRNKVVKQGELKTHSRLRVALVLGYEEEADLVVAEQRTWNDFLQSDHTLVAQSATYAPVELSVPDVIAELQRLKLPMVERHKASVVIERLWVCDEMPDYELLTLLAHSYGRLRTLLMRCHQLLGLTPARVSLSRASEGDLDCHDIEVVEEYPLNGRLPCMASSRSARTTRRRLLDGSLVTEFISDRTEYDPEISETLAMEQPYGEPPDLSVAELGDLQSRSQLDALLDFYVAMATGILKSGQDHGWFTHYFRKGRMLGSRLHMTVDSQGKHAIASEISRIALELDSDAVVMVGEAWIASLVVTQDGGYVPPQYHPDRTEGVLINAIARSGAVAGRVVPFRVLAGSPPHRNIEIQEATEQGGVIGLLVPTRQAWGCGAPALSGAAFWHAQRRRLL